MNDKVRICLITDRFPTANPDEEIICKYELGYFIAYSFSDFDIVVIDQKQILTYTDVQIIKSSQEFEAFFNKPSIIVCITTSPKIMFARIDSTMKFKTVSSYDWLPFSDELSIINKCGECVIPTPEAKEFENLFKDFEFSWECYFSSYPQNYKVIATDRSGNLAVGLKLRYKEGLVFIIPRPKSSKYTNFLRQVIDICKEKLKEMYSQQTKPKWADDFIDPIECEIRKEINQLYNKLQIFQEAKKLLYGKSNELTKVVNQILIKMGFNTKLKEETGIHDIEIAEDDFKAVIEVTSSKNNWINIRKVRQLLDWQGRFKKEYGIKPKAILIANPYSEFPPNERDEPFTRDALRKAEEEDVCLITTLDLYKIFCDFFKGKLTKKDIKEMFEQCKGLLKYKHINEQN